MQRFNQQFLGHKIPSRVRKAYRRWSSGLMNCEEVTPDLEHEPVVRVCVSCFVSELTECVLNKYKCSKIGQYQAKSAPKTGYPNLNQVLRAITRTHTHTHARTYVHLHAQTRT